MTPSKTTASPDRVDCVSSSRARAAASFISAGSDASSAPSPSRRGTPGPLTARPRRPRRGRLARRRRASATHLIHRRRASRRGPSLCGPDVRQHAVPHQRVEVGAGLVEQDDLELRRREGHEQLHGAALAVRQTPDVSRCLSLLTPVAASSASSVASAPPSVIDRSRAPLTMLATLSEARPLPQLSCVCSLDARPRFSLYPTASRRYAIDASTSTPSRRRQEQIGRRNATAGT